MVFAAKVSSWRFRHLGTVGWLLKKKSYNLQGRGVHAPPPPPPPASIYAL